MTATNGAILIALLAVLGITIVQIGGLIWVHLFVGLLLMGPLALKLGSTGYRFMRYYTGNLRYRDVGPPPTPLRVIAPVVVISTLVVFASGVWLLLAGPSSRPTLLPIHKISFFVWVAFTSVHVLAHLPAVATGLRAEYAASTVSFDYDTPGRSGRALSLASALTLGAVLAILLIPQFSPWLSYHHLRHH